MKKRVCVIGMGRFGIGVTKELYQAGHDVLVIDSDEEKVQAMLDDSTYAIRADATNEEALIQLGVDEYDVVILALGDENVQASILIAMVLRDIGVPFIVARAANELHGHALDRIGVGRIVFPEEDSAHRLAHVELNPGILDYMEVTTDVGISKVRPQPYMIRKTLQEVGLAGSGADDSLAIVALRRGRRLILNPSKDETISAGDLLLVAGSSDQVARTFTLDETGGQLAFAR